METTAAPPATIATRSAAPPKNAAARQTATWLPGVVLAWAVGLIVFGACSRAMTFGELSHCLSAWTAYGILYGFACGQKFVGRAAAFAPVAAVLAMLASPDVGFAVAGVETLVVLAICLPLGLFVSGRPFHTKPKVFFAVGLLSLLQLLALTMIPTFLVISAVALCWLYVAWLCFVCMAIGSLLRSVFYGRAAGSVEIVPAEIWPRRFSLRELFQWTTWFAVIFAALGALQLPARAWLDGTICSLVACLVAFAVIRFRPQAQS